MVTVQFNKKKLVKNIYRRFCSGDVNSENQKNGSIMVHEK